MGEVALLASFDRRSDVLYIVTPDNRPAYGREDELGMVWRYAFDDDRLVGVTLIDFEGFWRERLTWVLSQMVKRFKVSRKTARQTIDAATANKEAPHD